MTKGKIAGIAAVVVALAVAAFSLPIAEWTIALSERARGTGAMGVAIFAAAYVGATVALIPGLILTLAAGFVYGPVWGLVIASPVSVAAATAAFLLGRTFLHDWATRQMGDAPRVRAVRQAVTREGFKLVMLLRLSPLVPFNLLNYMLSLSDVRLGTYVIASAIGMLPATALYVYLGSLATTAAELASAAEGGGAGRTALSVAGLAATAAVVVIVTRTARKALDAELDSQGTAR